MLTRRDLLKSSAVAGAGLLVAGYVDGLRYALPAVAKLGLTVVTELGPAQTSGDPKLLERMVWNLVDNAVRHNEMGGWMRITTGAVSEPG